MTTVVTEKTSLSEYAEQLAQTFTDNSSTSKRKTRGQYFTPSQTARYMAGLFKLKKGPLKILDPGAGTGILTAALCERILEHGGIPHLVLDAYENDPSLIPLLKKTLELCKSELENKGCDVKINLFAEDYILENQVYANGQMELLSHKDMVYYDYIIANPPYYKLRKSATYVSSMERFVCGQPNIYTFFMILSALMLKQTGEMAFITPRSFCSGLYYKTFRKWFLNNMSISRIHVFESRKELFSKVLQENIILKAKKQNIQAKNVVISTSRNGNFGEKRTINVPAEKIIDQKTKEAFIKVPTSSFDVSILGLLDKWPSFLNELGFQISTGPVVPFRAKKYLLYKPLTNKSAVPLIWMHNMQGMSVQWPGNHNKKPVAINVPPEKKSLLLPAKNYVLVKRFSAKEQTRRLHAAVLLKQDLPYSSIGIENHVNYIHKPHEETSPDEAYGLCAVLNSTIADKYFRALNGCTQVNATDIRNMPLPSKQSIAKIGHNIYRKIQSGQHIDLDQTIADVLCLDRELMDKMHKDEEKHVKS